MTASGQKTAKITIEGEQPIVEAVAGQLQEFFEVTYRSKTNHIAWKPGKVKLYLHVVPLSLPEE